MSIDKTFAPFGASATGSTGIPLSGVSVVISVGAAALSRGVPKALARPPSEFTVAQCPDSPQQVLSCSRRLAPCVLVVEEEFLRRLESEEIRGLLANGSGIKVMVLVKHWRSGVDEELMRMGCRGALPADTGAPTFRRAARAVARGEIWASRGSISRVVRSLLFRDSHPLTGREQQILKLIAGGCSNREIGAKLLISRETVRWHVRGLYAKIGVGDRRSAVTYAKDLEHRVAAD